MKNRLIFATNNSHKIEEVAAFLDNKWEIITLKECGINEDIPEEQPTIEGNALQKARYIYEKTGKDCFADDTALEVEALNGEPGVRSARYAGEDCKSDNNIALLLENLKNHTERKAAFRTVIALIIGGKEHLFEGRVDGEIITTCQGGSGFGYDPIFRPEGYNITFAEMPLEEKNKISHRARAVAKLVEFLG
ncbi:MAG: non-canonical purine NTP diphosphatase [Rikenellaceae bacterium]